MNLPRRNLPRPRRPRPHPVADQVARRRRAGRDRCSLCGRKAVYLGFWCPDEKYQRKVMAPPGKLRAITYMLCERCKDSPGMPDQIEAAILADFAAMAASPEMN